MAANLTLHMGALAVSRDDVFNSPTPPPHGAHYPIRHAELLDRVGQVITRSGYEIVGEAHALKAGKLRGEEIPGAQYFGLLEVRRANELAKSYAQVIGLRNAHDLVFAASIAIGSSVFVCDNLAFSGEVTLARKHTRYVRRDLPGVVVKAFGQLADQRHKQDQRISAYQDFQMNDTQVKAFAFDSAINRCLGVTQLMDVWQQWSEPAHEEFRPRTMWSLFNAYTEVFKGLALPTLSDRTRRLHGQCDAVAGLALAK